jgi:hypothetical protein
VSLFQGAHGFGRSSIRDMGCACRYFGGLIQIIADLCRPRCREILHLCDGDHRRFLAAVEEWVKFACAFLVKQRAFRKSGRYGSDNFEEIRQTLYADDEKMSQSYLMAPVFSFLF